MRQRKLGVSPGLKAAIRIPHTRRKYKRGMRKKAMAMLAQFDENIARREEKLLRLYEYLKERNDTKDVPLEPKTCVRCGRTWYRCKAFFYRNLYRMATMTTAHFSNTCVICEAKRRHQKHAQRYARKKGLPAS